MSRGSGQRERREGISFSALSAPSVRCRRRPEGGERRTLRTSRRPSSPFSATLTPFFPLSFLSPAIPISGVKQMAGTAAAGGAAPAASAERYRLGVSDGQHW